MSRSAGTSTRQRPKTFGQRVEKTQPGGGFAGLGTSPLRMIRVRRASTSGSGLGTAEISASE